MAEYNEGFADKKPTNVGGDKVTCSMAVDLHRGSICSGSRWKKMEEIIAIVSMA